MGTEICFAETRGFFGLPADELAELARRLSYRQRELAGAFGLSSRSLERYFRKRFGRTPSEWLIEVRMQHAAGVLRQGGTIKEAAEFVAFRHRTSFHRKFRRCFKCTPQQFLRGGNISSAQELESSRNARLSQSATLLSRSATPVSLPARAAL